MHVEGSVSGSLTKNFHGVSVVTDHPDANTRRKIGVMRTPVPTDMGYKKHFPPRETAFAVHQAYRATLVSGSLRVRNSPRRT
jgi:hypothetical protein